MDTSIGIFYGSTTGNTEAAVELIEENLAKYITESHDIANSKVSDFDQYQFLILGISTWEYGGLQDDWESFWQQLDSIDFTDKVVALFGQGDQVGYSDWFQDALGNLYHKVIEQGATIIGYWPNTGYQFNHSEGLTEDKKEFFGLALDDDNQPELTDERVHKWCLELSAIYDELFIGIAS